MREKLLSVGTNYPGLYRRGNVYQFRKAIPEGLRSVAGKHEFIRSLGTNDPNVALTRYWAVLSEFDELIASARSGVMPSRPQASFELLSSVANNLGLPYQSASELAERGDVAEVVKRLRVWEELGRPKGTTFQAIFGEAERQASITKLLEDFFHDIRDELARLNPHEQKKRINPKKRAIKML